MDKNIIINTINARIEMLKTAFERIVQDGRTDELMGCSAEDEHNIIDNMADDMIAALTANDDEQLTMLNEKMDIIALFFIDENYIDKDKYADQIIIYNNVTAIRDAVKAKSELLKAAYVNMENDARYAEYMESSVGERCEFVDDITTEMISALYTDDKKTLKHYNDAIDLIARGFAGTRCIDIDGYGIQVGIFDAAFKNL